MWEGSEGKGREGKERKGKEREGKGRARVCWVLGWEVIVWGWRLAVEVGAGRGVGDEEIGGFEAWEKNEWRDDEGRESTKEISKEWYHGQKWEGCGGIRNEWTRTSTDVESKLDK